MNAYLPGLTLFFGSFLLFGIQPMLGRTLLEPFGGTATVWVVCLAAYQVLLLAGYAYAHMLVGKPGRLQRRWHLGLLGAAAGWVYAFAALRPSFKNHLGSFPAPSLEVLFCVLVFVGLPYILLAANSTLIQAWLARSPVFESVGDPACADRRRVYRLYAVSNLGSLSGLLIYPFLLEPVVPLNVQWYGLATCLLLYTFLLAYMTNVTRALRDDEGGREDSRAMAVAHLSAEATTSGLPTALTRPWLWVALPALSAFMLNSVTMHLTTDITPMPMIWAFLLAVFLLSYVLGFSAIGEKGLVVWACLSVILLLFAAMALGLRSGFGFLPNLAVGLCAILVCGTFIHGWLYRIRPAESQLTRFYLGIAIGGAVGGCAASLGAPVLFSSVLEYPFAVLATTGFCVWFFYSWNRADIKGLTYALFCIAAATVCTIGENVISPKHPCLLRARSFYGCLRVTNEEMRTKTLGTVWPFHALYHGETVHGYQMQVSYLRDAPTAYYGLPGGGIALHRHPAYTNGASMRIGLIGLGVGTMACYGRANDLYRFFEIDPQVIAIASRTNLFTFLSDSAARIEIVAGDARKTLERERTSGAPRYDVLVVDAYSGDSVPYHLSTLEAFRLYRDRLAPGGTLALHISNWHVDLLPLCKAMAQGIGLQATGIVAYPTGVTSESLWVMMTAAPRDFAWEHTRLVDWSKIRDIPPPRDECGSLLSLIRFLLPRTAKKSTPVFDE